VNAVARFPTPSVMEKFSAALGWVNLSTKEWNLLGYYNSRYTCSINFSIFGRHYHSSNYFTFIFLFYNLIVSLLIYILYVLVTIKVNRSDGRCLSNSRWCNLPCCFSRRSYNTHFQPNNAERPAENRKIFKRIAFIVFTDLMCWIPLSITTLVLWGVTNTSQQWTTMDDVQFQGATLSLVPINSIFNPYIYSYHLWVRLFHKIRIKLCNK